MAVRRIEIDRHETNHNVATIYATVFDNGLVDIRRNFISKLDVLPGRTPDEMDAPENRLTIQQLTKLLEDINNG